MSSFPLRLTLLSALACTTPAEPAQETPAPSPTDAHIRFGDPPDLAYDAPFFPGAEHDAGVPDPAALLGQELGTRLSHHGEIVTYFRDLAASSPRVTVHSYGRTHEGRELIYAVVTSEANHGRLEAILADLDRLHDPRGLSEAEGRELVKRTPPVAWMGYSIHGDELSGCDAALALGHHLAADTGEEVAGLLGDLVVVIDPCMNPDGRERIISMVEQSAGYTPNLDYASMHRGRWPYGRGNHYLFDMNRDWMAGSQPETRGRWSVALRFHPQLFVDAHEMGSLDTFLFYPQEKPLNPHFPPRHAYWHGEFAADIATAFDGYGWGYYTREWADGWAPFYSDAWSSLTGAIGILYEQASTSGFPLRRASGQILTYREAVHHQAAASMANLRTLRARGEEVLADYLANKRRNVAADTPGNDRAFVLVPGANRTRERALLSVLLGQGIECGVASEAFNATGAEGVLGQRAERREFPAGSIVVPARQPMAQLVKAFLAFDPRLSKEALQAEREEIEQTGSTKIYDLTAWSLPHAFGLDSWWCDAPEVRATALTELPALVGGVEGPADAAYAWAVDAADDAAVPFAVRAMERGLAVHVCDRPFTTGGRTFSRGSLLIRRHENEGDAAAIAEHVAAAARESGARVHATASGRSPDDGPDLGGQHFDLLSRPRVAVLANAPVTADRYGHLWHELDARLGVPFTLLDAQGGGDLRRYNVLVLPPGSGSYLRERSSQLQRWVEGGGTLIAIADAAAAAAGSDLSAVVLRRNALEDLDDYASAVERERSAFRVEVDEASVWGDPSTSPAEAAADEEQAEAAAPAEVDDELDAWMRGFSPYGVNLLAEVNPRHWITAGAGTSMPVYFSGSRVFLSRAPVDTPVRLAPAEDLRLGGLVWPEARSRIADSAWLTVESRGRGQVILFAAMPAFRGYHAATARLFANAVVLGPGLGASQPLGW